MVERTESRMASEFLEILRNYLENFVLGAEWALTMSRMGRAGLSQQFVLSMRPCFVPQVGE